MAALRDFKPLAKKFAHLPMKVSENFLYPNLL